MVTFKKVKITLIYCKIARVRFHLINYISILGLITQDKPTFIKTNFE